MNVKRSNLTGIMTFGQMLKRLKVEPYYQNEGEEFIYSETFMGRDRNDLTVGLSRDGESTCYVHLPGVNVRQNVAIDTVALLLHENGFDTDNSRWDTEESLKILPDDEEGYVYVLQMQGTNLYKIGRTKHYRSRLKLLGVLMPKPCDFVGVWHTKHMRTLELVMHRDYAVHHSNGEWFALPNLSKTVEFLDFTQKRVM